MLVERIGEYLLIENVITIRQLADALEIQKKEPKKKRRFLGDILLEIGAFSKEEFSEHLKHFLLQFGKHAPSEELLIGNILVQCNAVSKNDLNEAVAIQEKSSNKKFIGEILIDMGKITLEQLEVFLSNQKKIRELLTEA